MSLAVRTSRLLPGGWVDDGWIDRWIFIVLEITKPIGHKHFPKNIMRVKLAHASMWQLTFTHTQRNLLWKQALLSNPSALHNEKEMSAVGTVRCGLSPFWSGETGKSSLSRQALAVTQPDKTGCKSDFCPKLFMQTRAHPQRGLRRPAMSRACRRLQASRLAPNPASSVPSPLQAWDWTV